MASDRLFVVSKALANNRSEALQKVPTMRDTIDTTPKSFLSTIAPKDLAKRLAARPAHELNDKLVTLREGARGASIWKLGADILGGSGLKGLVWGVSGGQALVDFGCTSSGNPLRVVVAESDLEVVS